ncbi:MAG: AMP-binding protein [Candidatus Parcubacteria bacterium]|nr:AMP-binding protein [Burkholderiales bacterium]
MNIAHECLDRHRGRGTAVSIKFADGRAEHYSFAQLADDSSRFAHWLARRGVRKGDRVAVLLDPSRAFYVAMFGAVKYGAVAVPMFTLFGPDALALRLEDCKPSLIVTLGKSDALRSRFPGLEVVDADSAFWEALEKESADFTPSTAAADLAVFQYTSGTTRELPEAVKHTHRSVVTLMVAALYGVGLESGDRYFCPSSPAWGHGLWHGTIAPLALGIHIAAYSGKFDPLRALEALQDFGINNFSAAPTVIRMIRNSEATGKYRIGLQKLSYTGEPMDLSTWDWAKDAFGTAPCSMYGSTEVGVLVVNFPGFPDYKVKRGALGMPVPGLEVEVIDKAGTVLPPKQSGEIAVKRKDGWFFVKDRGYRDEEGYLFIEGRSDDVIISAGWTMSAVEIENTLLKHPAVAEAAVVGVPDSLRGQVAKAYIVARHGKDGITEEIQKFMKAQLSQHEYPRHVEFVGELPKTPAGKINRKALKEKSWQKPKQ